MRPIAVFLMFAVCGIAILVIAAASGIGTGPFQRAAQASLTSILGQNANTTFGDARLTFGGPAAVGIELRDVQLSTNGDSGHSVAAERIRFGIELAPLLAGRAELSGINLSHVSIRLGEGGSDLAAGLLNNRGLIDPDKVAASVFDSMREIVSATSRLGSAVSIDRAEIGWLSPSRLPSLMLSDLTLEDQGDGSSLNANLKIGEIEAGLSAQVRNQAESLSFLGKMSIPDFEWNYTPGTLKKPFARKITAAIRISLDGSKTTGQPGSINSELAIDDFVLETVKDERQNSTLRVTATLDEGAGKLEIENIVADIGKAHLELHGAIQPAPEAQSLKPIYRYELVSDGSRITAADSPERPIGVLARLAGIIDLPEGRITADELGVRTTGGEVIGNGALVFPGGKTPAAFLNIQVPKMPVAHAKQLWPWKAADGARSWVLDNVFGGEVRDSWLEMSTVAGRFGDAFPFTADEVSGHFKIFGTRFDTAGEIPPVRDANGTVDFGGTNVTIRLSSGTAYMPSGRTVDAANGEFRINAAIKPLVGALEIDVAGNADAVAELATYDPINADRYIELGPDDFTGTVTGHVGGNIPLQAVPDREALSWRVALDYSGLAVAKPFGGQELSDATGSIVVDPQTATIRAKGKLNGLPAEFSLAEPLDGDDNRRKLDLKLELDDKVRAEVAPQLNTVVSGPVVVDIKEADDGSQTLHADVTKATLSFPWAGWTKGPGIPGKASFRLRDDGEITRLTDIRLEGKSFFLSGSAILNKGDIQSAQFSGVKLNRDDSFDLSIKRDGRGYDMSVKGERIDARSLIKQFLSDVEEASEGLDDVPVRLTAKARQVRGFGNEIVSDVDIVYSGTGSRASGLQISATTASGQRFAVRQEGAQGARTVTMQSADAGAILRFLDIYGNMQGGSIDLRMTGADGEPLRGQIDARDFWVVNEPRLEALVSTAPDGDDRSLSQAVKRDIDVSKAKFEQGFARIEKGNGYLAIADGVLRGPLIGSTFQGHLYDANGNMSLTGTFMPAYGLNRLFADIPVVGLILGNGRDRGLIGITYKLSGDAKSPKLLVNPISIIAPGIFRSIFEFR